MEAETNESDGQKIGGAVAFWIAQIDAYNKKAQKWEKRSDKIIDRYADERSVNTRAAKYNILWSNVQTLLPALYDKAPNPNVERRFQDDDDLGLLAAQVLERSVSYFVKSDDFDDCMRQTVLDRLLPGRGTAWVRYVPNIQDVTQLTDDTQVSEAVQSMELYGEDVIVDYVHWKDFGHTIGKTWQEVRAVWRSVPMDRKALQARFGEELGSQIPLNAKRDDVEGSTDDTTAMIYEIWDKKTKKAFWIHRDWPTPLDERDDPLKLKGFFPCPKPLYATLTNKSLIPIPDYTLYQDQALELDNLTSRIDLITKALKVAGVYDASAEGVQSLLSEAVENKLVPVENYAIMGEKGGLKGVISLLPVQEIAGVLMQLYDARERVKQDLYEITGMSDIIRGASNANETATAQQIKGQYASLRLGYMQRDVARFSRDLVKIMAEIISEHFSLETIKNISGVKLLTGQEKQMAMMAAQSGQQLPPQMADLMNKPTWDDVFNLLKNDQMRCFRVDIETDSTIKADQEAEKQSRIEFLGAVGGFMQQAAVSPPDLQPLLMQMLMFGVRGFRAGRELETEFKAAFDTIKKKAEQPQIDPAAAEQQMKMQAEAQAAQVEAQKTQIEAQIAEAEMMLKKLELDLKAKELELKQADTVQKYQLEREKIASTEKQALLAARQSSPDGIIADDLETATQSPLMVVAEMLKANSEQTNAALVQMAQMQNQNMQNMVAVLTQPKEVVRGPDGKILGVKTAGIE